jgi:hypothetical protein
VVKELSAQVPRGTVYLSDLDLDAEFATFSAETGPPPAAADESPLGASDLDWPTQTLVDFEWVGGGPPGWDAQLELLDFGRPLAFVCWARDFDSNLPWRLVGGISPKDNPACFERLFWLPEGGIPTKITNRVPKLISRSKVIDAVRLFLEQNNSWADFLEQYGAEVADSEETRAGAINSYFEHAYSEV